MQRRAFQLRIREGQIDAYDEAHRHVWPELLDELQRFGVTDYSIFRRGQTLFLTLRVADFDDLLRSLAQSDVNRRWQEKMAPIFEPVPDLKPGETLAMMHEVFFLQGGTEDRGGKTSEGANAE